MTLALRIAPWVVLSAVAGCQHRATAQFPPRPAGCSVDIATEAPSIAVDEIGRVSARCTDPVSDDDCRRTLADQVCKLGGDLVWGVTSELSENRETTTLRGRAVKKR